MGWRVTESPGDPGEHPMKFQGVCDMDDCEERCHDWVDNLTKEGWAFQRSTIDGKTRFICGCPNHDNDERREMFTEAMRGDR